MFSAVTIAYDQWVPLMPRDAADSLEIVFCQPAHVVLGRWRNLTIVYWMQQANGPIVGRIRGITEAMAKAHPNGFSSIHLVRSGAPLPDADARQGFSKLMEDFAQQMSCIGVVMMGAGFWASALQSMVTGFSMVARRSFILRFAREPAELCSWLPVEHQKRTGRALEVAALAQVMDEIIQVGERSENEREKAAV